MSDTETFTPAGAAKARGADWRDLPSRGRGLSLRTLVVLRWLALAGQSATVVVAHEWLHFDLPLETCTATILAGVLVNLSAMTRLRDPDAGVPDGRVTATQLGFDIVQLSLMLGLTGGLENPFCLLLVAPVTVAAASLPGRRAIVLGVMVLAAVIALYLWSAPLPWRAGRELILPDLYRLGTALALVVGVVFTSAYAWRVAADAEELELALAASHEVMGREQRLAALGGLAAAAAHELGTPLATIQVVAREMLREAPAGGGLAEDAALLLTQAERCREILTRLSQRPEDGDALYVDIGLKPLLVEASSPHEGLDLEFKIEVEGDAADAPFRLVRAPEIVHGLSALIENAADFAAGTVVVRARLEPDRLTVAILDDGPGFSAEVAPRLGEPWVTSRPHGKVRRALSARLKAPRRRRRDPPDMRVEGGEGDVSQGGEGQGGMGLGFFIARTLLERTGAAVSIGQGLQRAGGRGAGVMVVWPRAAVEAKARRGDAGS